MKISHAIGDMITSPLFAVVVCSVGVALWYYAAPPTIDTAMAQPDRATTTLEQTRATPARTPVIKHTLTKASSVEKRTTSPMPPPTAPKQPAPAADKTMTIPREDTASPLAVALATTTTTMAGRENNEIAETHEADDSNSKEHKTSRGPPRRTRRRWRSSARPRRGAVLDARGLRKSGSFYVIATEKEISGFLKIKPIYNVMDTVLGQYQAILNAEMTFLYWDNERTLAQTYIGDLDMALANTPNTIPNRLAIQQYQRERAATQLYLNNVLGALEIARKNLVPPARKQAVWNEFLVHRAEFLEANKQLRPIVDKANAEYVVLKRDPAVKDALQTLSKRSNSPIKLGPSKALSTASRAT